MLTYHLVSLFPEYFQSPLATGLMQKARENGVVDFCFHNPRQYAVNRHGTVDDSPYGGGPGMVLMLEPLLACLETLVRPGNRLVALSPAGKPFTQEIARSWAKEKEITLVCGRYEGFDARMFDVLPVEPISVGDAVLNGGEAAALAVIEATARLIPGFMGKESSGEEESFSNGLLEYPHYTRPDSWQGHAVPDILLSGDHAKIGRWRREQSLVATLRQRPDLLAHAPLSFADREVLCAQGRFRPGKNLHIALVHHPVLLKEKKVGTSSLTNLDVHDIARSSRTYGLGSVFVVSPLEDQLHLLQTLLDYWVRGAGSQSNSHRAQALSLVQGQKSVEDCVASLTQQYGEAPVLVGSSARPILDKKGREVTVPLPFKDLSALLHERPVLLLLGTSHGLSGDLLAQCDHILPPLRWMDNYNHLPVRAAAALFMDRLLGDLG